MLEAKFANPVLAPHTEKAEPYQQGDYTTTCLLPIPNGNKVAVTFLSGKSRDDKSGFNLLTLNGIQEWSAIFDDLENENYVEGIIIADSADPNGKGINPGIDVKEFGPALQGLANDNAQPMNHLLNVGCYHFERVYQHRKPVAGVLASRNMGGIIELVVNPVGFLALGNKASIMSPECQLDLLKYLEKVGYDSAKDFGIEEANIRDRFNVFEGWLQAQTGLQAMLNRRRQESHQRYVEFNERCAFEGHEVSANEALKYGRTDVIGIPEILLPMAVGWIENSVGTDYTPKTLVGENGWGPIEPPKEVKRTTVGQVAGAHVLYGRTYRSLDEMIAMNNAALIQSIVEGYNITQRCSTVYDQARKVTGVESFLDLREAA